jgi:hypothetical protein
VQVPEPVSPRYRSRVLKVSCRCRSHSVKDVPEPHTQKMWCKCGAGRPLMRWEETTSTHRTATTWAFSGADDGIRTRDPHLGKVMLYQLSHVRVTSKCSKAVADPQRPGHETPPLIPAQGPRAQDQSTGPGSVDSDQPTQLMDSASRVGRRRHRAQQLVQVGLQQACHRGHVWNKTTASEHPDMESAHIAESRDVEAHPFYDRSHRI